MTAVGTVATKPGLGHRRASFYEFGVTIDLTATGRQDDGVVTLEASGSPGAIVPATARIEALLHGAVPEVAEVRVVWPDAEPTRPAESDELAERVRRVLDDEVNPAIAAHRGRVTLVDVIAGRVSIRLDGGCQGC